MISKQKRIGLKVLKFGGMIIGGLAIGALIALAFGFLVMLLWNWLMPAIFGLKAITYWQGFGIVLLAHLIFGHFGGGHHGHGKHWKSKDWKCDDWGDSAEWKIEGGWKDWKHYKDFWKEEGKEAFENYVKNKKE